MQKFLRVMLGCWLASSVAVAAAVQRVDASDVRWRDGDPAGGATAASDEAPTWTAGDGARKAAAGADVIWLSLTLPTGDWRAPALLLEGVAGTVELFSDGRRLTEENDESSFDAVSALRVRPVPRSLLGQRVELRVASAGFPPSLRQVSVGEQSQLDRMVITHGFSAAVGGLLMFAVALLAFAAWLIARGNLFPLRVFAVAVSGGMMSFGLGAAASVFLSSGAQHALVILGVAALPWSTLALMREGFSSFAPAWTRWLERAALAWGLVFAMSLWFPMELATQSSPLVFIASIGVSLTVGWRAMRAGSVEGRLLATGLGVLFAVTVYDSLPMMGLRIPSGFHTHWSLLAMTLSFVAIFAHRLLESAQHQRQQAEALAQKERQGRAVAVSLLTDATELLTAVEQLRQSSTSQSQVIEKQASALQETQVTAEEIKRTSALAAEKARALLDQAAVADQAGREGEQSVGDSLDGLSAIGSEVAAMAQAMGDVETLTLEIGSIVDVVKELADQSNMLALNAAIEAVRSGEHGKGFAVVAREVRRLADQSLQSTVRIRAVLERLADGVRQSSQAGERGERSVARTLEQLRGSGEQLRTMSGLLRETNASVRQISAAVTQQNAGISQIFTAVEHLSEQMREAVKRLQEAEAATVVVESVASRMSENRLVA